MDFAVEWRTKKEELCMINGYEKGGIGGRKDGNIYRLRSFMEAIFGVMKFKDGRKLIDLRWF